MSVLSFTLVTLASGSVAAAAGFQMQPRGGELLAQHCFSCHDEETQMGRVRLDELAKLPLEARLELLTATPAPLLTSQAQGFTPLPAGITVLNFFGYK